MNDKIQPDELKDLISQLGLNQASFANRIGCSRITVWRWVNGKTKIPNQTLKMKDKMHPSELRDFIAKMGLSQADFAKRVGCSRVTVWRWTNGKTKIPNWMEVAINGLRSIKKENI
jgi:transcriptional regulator with XRE-family HTH domain